MSHTPGPWRARAGSGGRPSIIYGHDGWPVADVMTYHGRATNEQQEANTRLIIAAPRLLENLQRIVRFIEVNHALLANCGEVDAARAAIAEVTGKQEDAS